MPLQPYFLWTHNGKEITQRAPEYPEIHQMQHAHICCLLLDKWKKTQRGHCRSVD